MIGKNFEIYVGKMMPYQSDDWALFSNVIIQLIWPSLKTSLAIVFVSTLLYFYLFKTSWTIFYDRDKTNQWRMDPVLTCYCDICEKSSQTKVWQQHSCWCFSLTWKFDKLKNIEGVNKNIWIKDSFFWIMKNIGNLI